MNSKAVPFIALAGVLVAYLFYKKQQAVKGPTSPVSNPGNYKPAQPSQVYPFQPTVAPRVDNANQPWYNGPRVPMLGQVDQSPPGIVGLAQQVSAGASIVHSVSDVWSDLSGYFGNGEEEYSLNADQYEDVG